MGRSAGGRRRGVGDAGAHGDPDPARRREPARGLRALPDHAADHDRGHLRGAADRDAVDVHGHRGGDRVPGRLLEHRRRGPVPRRCRRHHGAGAGPAGPACRGRAAARLRGRGRGWAGVGLTAGLAQAARRDRRGRDDAAAQPGGPAGRPGPAQRTLAQLEQRFHRLRPVRHRVRPAGAGARQPRALGLRRRAADHRGDRLRDGPHPDRAADPRRGSVAQGSGVQRHRGGPAAVPRGAGLRRHRRDWAARRR